MSPGRPRSVTDTGSVQTWLKVSLFASIFLQRFSIGSPLVAANLLVTYVALLAIGLRGSLVIDPLRMALLLAFLACTFVSSMLSIGQGWSGLAVAVLIAV